MKINSKSQLGILFNDTMRAFILEKQMEGKEGIYPQDVIDKAKSQLTDMISDEKNKNYIFTQTAINISKKIKINSFQPEFLKHDEYLKATFLLGRGKFYRVIIGKDEIMGMRCELTDIGYFTYNTFKIYTSLNTVNYPENPVDYMNDDNFKEFLQMLIFFQYSDISEKIIAPNQKTGTRREGKFYNESDKKITVVDSTWNNVVIRDEGFTVSGHFRWQKYGIGRNKIKLIYIDEFEKSGYIRGAQKLN